MLINLALPFIIALIFTFTSGDTRNAGSNFFLAYGTIALLGFLFNLVIGIILLIAGPGTKENGKKLLLAAGVLLLVGAATCSVGLGAMNFH